MEKRMCANHAHAIHDCIEKIINGFRHERSKFLPHKDRLPHMMASCRQVDVMLAQASEAVFHRKDHEPVWESIVFQHGHALVCTACGGFFTDSIIEAAKKLKIL